MLYKEAQPPIFTPQAAAWGLFWFPAGVWKPEAWGLLVPRLSLGMLYQEAQPPIFPPLKIYLKKYSFPGSAWECYMRGSASHIHTFPYSMGRSRYQFLENQPHFLTCTVVNWIAVFSKPDLAQIILNSLDFLQSHQRLALHGYVIMENHLHLIASAENLSREIAAFKSFTARSVIDWLKDNQTEYLLKQLKFHKKLYKTTQEYQLWQEGSHPQAIFSQQMFSQKLEYMHNNPLRRGYVDDPAHWRYSSYRNYMGMKGVLAIDLIDV